MQVLMRKSVLFASFCDLNVDWVRVYSVGCKGRGDLPDHWQKQNRWRGLCSANYRRELDKWWEELVALGVLATLEARMGFERGGRT